MNNQEFKISFEDLRRKDSNKELGRGVSSAVFEMVHKQTNKSFAVKVSFTSELDDFFNLV